MTFLELFDSYHDMVYRIALSYTKSPADAEDICQEVFIKALERRPPEPGKEKSWLTTVTINQCKDTFKSAWRKNTVPLEEAVAFEDPREETLFAELMKLKRAHRIVIYLYYYEGYSLGEIAQQLGQSYSAVKMRLYHARRELKRVLEEEDYYEFA